MIEYNIHQGAMWQPKHKSCLVCTRTKMQQSINNNFTGVTKAKETAAIVTSVMLCEAIKQIPMCSIRFFSKLWAIFWLSMSLSLWRTAGYWWQPSCIFIYVISSVILHRPTNSHLFTINLQHKITFFSVLPPFPPLSVSFSRRRESQLMRQTLDNLRLDQSIDGEDNDQPMEQQTTSVTKV